MGSLVFYFCLRTVYFFSPLNGELLQAVDISVSVCWHTVDSQLMSAGMSCIDYHFNSRSWSLSQIRWSAGGDILFLLLPLSPPGTPPPLQTLVICQHRMMSLLPHYPMKGVYKKRKSALFMLIMATPSHLQAPFLSFC